MDCIPIVNIYSLYDLDMSIIYQREKKEMEKEKKFRSIIHTFGHSCTLKGENIG